MSALRLADLEFETIPAAWRWFDQADDAERLRVAQALGLSVDPQDPVEVARRLERALDDAVEARRLTLDLALPVR